MRVGWQRPTVETKFHIDLDWWQQQKRDIRVYMRELLCDECRSAYSGYNDETLIDWIDEQTGEVTPVDGLWHLLRTCCGQKTDFVGANMPILDAIFRTFLANGNNPLSINELYDKVDHRPPATLLRMLTSGQVYLGIRPVR